jgi:hypothetical protein
MPRCGPQVVGIPYDCTATVLSGLEAHVYEPQRDRMEPFAPLKMIQVVQTPDGE